MLEEDHYSNSKNKLLLGNPVGSLSMFQGQKGIKLELKLLELK